MRNKNRAPRHFVAAAHRTYASRVVPDFIHQKIDSMVQEDLSRYASDSLSTWKDWRQKTNDCIDFEFSHLVDHLCAAKIRADSSAFIHYKELSQRLSRALSFESGNTFWSQWLPTVFQFSASEALTYLKAQRADRCCRSLYEGMNTIEEAELYTSAALFYAEKIDVPRLKLDISQRITVYLHRKYGLYDLAIHIAEVEAPQAEKLHYAVRLVGLRYNAGMAMYKSGHNEEAYREFSGIMEIIERHAHIPEIAGYKISVILHGLIAVHFQNGDYAAACRLCDMLEAGDLSLATQIELTLYRGLVAAELGDFDNAESYYQFAFSQARELDKKEHLVTTLINLGDLKYNLAEPDMALALYDSAKQIVEKYAAFNNRQQINILSNMVEVYSALGNQTECQRNLAALEEITRKMENPRLRGINLFNLGSLYIKTDEIAQAEKVYRQALDLFQHQGLKRQYLETAIEWMKCLLILQDYEQAAAALAIIKEQSFAGNDALGIIEYYGLAAELSFARGEIKKAIEFSEALWHMVTDLRGDIYSITNLTLFNQRVYHYLKNAVLYEIERFDNEAAFLKLENAKAWALKKMHNSGELHDSDGQMKSTIREIRRWLPEDGILVNYCVSAHTLYAFCLLKNDLHLVKMAITSDELEEICSSFTTAIRQSGAILAKNDSLSSAANYEQIWRKAHETSAKLLTPDFRAHVHSKKNIYLVPDEILWNLPFCCLLVKDQNRTAFWVEESSITYLPSASFIIEYGASTTSETDLNQKTIVYSVDDRFPESADICRYIAGKCPHAEKLSVHCSPFHKDSVLVNLGKEKDVVIFFGHCQSNNLRPDLSFITTTVFNRADSSWHTIQLTLRDLKNVNWRDTGMIILMGCGTARGKLYKGSGLAGLQNGFLTLGVSQVLATLWEIDSYNAARQFETILEAMAQGKSLECALQESQVVLMHTLIKTIHYPHPFIWASYRVARTKLL
ncbi:CHAT domain-containing protein [candidate division KSB1 bacterium]|nr:CHAT domain-containing protein [candidate division KSB1 bacterium]